jgi:CBS domain containing-hemolysin-like protein
MTPEDHNKYLGLAHVGYGVLHILIMLLTGAVVAGMMGALTLNSARGNGPPLSFMAVIMAVAVGINVLLAIPSFLAGYAFLKKKRWAKTAGVVAAVFSALRFPFGTIVAVYTFWFLFSVPGRTLYDNLPQALPPAPPVDWNDMERRAGREAYSPPDWR